MRKEHSIKRECAALLCRAFLLIAAFLLLNGSAREARAIQSPYTINATYNAFSVDKKILHAVGNVDMTYRSIRLQADYIAIDMRMNVLRAEGNVVLISSRIIIPATSTILVPTDGSVVDDVETLSQTIVNERSGSLMTYRGDILNYDLDNFIGELIQTSVGIRHVYLMGEQMIEMPSSVNLRSSAVLGDDISESAAMITAPRFRISPNAKYEAWRASMWVKGSKAATIPYYTNNGKGLTPGRWRLRNVHYSSNDSWAFGLGVRYLNANTHRGSLNFDYRDKALRGEHLRVGVDQNFSLTQKVGGGLIISDIGTDRYSAGLNLNRFSMRRRMGLNLNYSKDNDSANLNFSTPLMAVADINGAFSISRDRRYKSRYQSGTLHFDRKTNYVGKNKSIGIRPYAFTQYNESRPNGDSVASAFVGVNAFRSAWKFGNRTHMNINGAAGFGADTSGSQNRSVSGGLSLNRRIGRGHTWSVSYAYDAKNASNTRAVRNQSVSTGFSFMKPLKWNLRVDTNFNLQSSEFSNVSSYFNYFVNKKVQLNLSSGYDLKKDHFTGTQAWANINIYGAQLNARWNKSNNDFIIDLNSQFK